MMRQIHIAPSILAADWCRLGDEVQAIEKAGADWIHVDVMDGHFVPPITVGAQAVQALRPLTTLPLDVHLMVMPVDAHIDAFAKAGASILTVHPEAGPHLHRTLQTIRSFGVKAGVALNPATPLEAILSILPSIDLVLIMSVNPGYGGQAFIPYTLEKVRRLRHLIDERNLPILIEIDGGITPETAPLAIDAGVDVLVSGTAVFGTQGSPSSHAYASAIAGLRDKT
ncbi:MAG: ribulose-phosphate 3-epimerase [Alphaproteobacteria bacterium]|jgi:ribulose-phosphate 3-epimerase|nr:ribulose-phosphate 3-epimerase [Alphaproteobacteria bacterium]